DTTFELDSLILVLTAAGMDTLTWRYAISGRADTGNITVSPGIYELASLRNWKARFYTVDVRTGPPPVRDTVHIDSVIFAVLPGDTVFVNKIVSPALAILRARFLSHAADSLGSGIRYVRLKVDGITRD